MIIKHLIFGSTIAALSIQVKPIEVGSIQWKIVIGDDGKIIDIR